VFLRARYPLVVVFIAVLVYAFNYARTNMGFILFPTKGSEQLAVYVECPTGTPLQATAAVTGEVEKLVMLLPSRELETFTSRIGVVGWVGRGENYANIQVRLTRFTERDRTADQIVEDLGEKVNSVKGAEKISFEVYAGGPPVGRPITLRVIGNDDVMRARLGGEVEGFLRELPGAKDIDRDDKLGKEQLEIKLDYEKPARYGLTVADVAQNVRIAYDGQIVTSLRQGDEDVGGVQAGPGLNAYRHFDGDRTTTITGDVDTDVTTSPAAATAVLARFGDLWETWPGMRIVAGGEAEETQESIVSLFSTFIIAIVGIYFLLVLQFKSFTQPFLVMFTIPFGAIGVIFAHAVHNESLSFAGMIGLIGLAGVVVNDAIVLLTHLNELRKQRPDADLRQIVADGASDRLRAITLTTTTTVAGVLPIAYGLGGTNLFMAPMALTLILCRACT
jgi:multidrug efflux pump subunit AcrB